ncbi:hypothetical protein LTR78_007694 [Recurvomyces mirabilis]|uniref:Uncharacterized protein n=1 Tax=Recurvomyces mirabilis TaxID=574656 RepID=A0AAE0TUJ9_9PEZI|nr:hypothetical protein LTR78_007694 [Recurvomyces mirabilis]KAK5151581.1 hypothetical protein LTS14_009068 [Recurvomyces mirabilis]
MTIPLIRVRMKTPKVRRECAGYEANISLLKDRPCGRLLPANSFASPESLGSPKTCLTALPVHLEATQRQALQYFVTRAARQLFGHYSADLYEKLLFQVLNQQEVVLHACLAVSFMHRAHTLRRPKAGGASPCELVGVVPHERQALQHYVHAVSSLRILINHSNYRLDTSTVHIVLLVCLLCVHFSLLRGSETEAFTHLEKGLAVIFGLSRPYAPTSGKRFRPLTLSTTPTKTLELLLQEFVRLDGEFAAYATREPYLCPELDPDYFGDMGPARMRFRTLAEASIVLDTISNSVARHHGALLRYTTSHVDGLGTGFEDEAHRDAYIRASSRSVKHAMLTHAQERTSKALSAWSSALEALTYDGTGRLEYMKLRLQFFNTWFLNSTYNDSSEEVTDIFETTFDEVVHLAERYLLAHGKIGDEAVLFDPSPAAIPALFIVGMKCRSSSVRRKAITLLRNTTLQEGLWHGPPLAAFAEQVAEIEELRARRLNPLLSGLGTGTNELRCCDVPKGARYSDVVYVLDDGVADQQGGRLVCARIDRDRDYEDGGDGGNGEGVIVEQYHPNMSQKGIRTRGGRISCQ